MATLSATAIPEVTFVSSFKTRLAAIAIEGSIFPREVRPARTIGRRDVSDNRFGDVRHAMLAVRRYSFTVTTCCSTEDGRSRGVRGAPLPIDTGRPGHVHDRYPPAYHR